MKIAIVGAGGFGREVFALIHAINAVNQQFEVVGFVDDGIETGTVIHNVKVLGSVSDLPKIPIEGVVVAIGHTATRKRVVSQVPAGLRWPNIVHPACEMLDKRHIQMGIGNIICSGTIFTTDISIGNHCIVNLSCTIGHDAVLQDFCSIMPGVNISGGAKLMQGAYIGTGAKLIKATTLGEFCVIGAGAVVDSDIPAHTVAVGIPAKPIKKNE